MDLQCQTPGNPVGVVLSAHLVGDLLAASCFERRSPRSNGRSFCVVPELTRSADIKLNKRVSLQRRPERHVIIRRTIFHPRKVVRHWQSRQANMPPLGGFVLKVPDRCG
jgi:hypothetical protein